MIGNGDLRCPVCQARFRGATECPRCGADLTALMLLTSHAYVLRQAAQQLLRAGDAYTALASVRAAQGLHSTPEGNLLQFACATAANAFCGGTRGSGSRFERCACVYEAIEPRHIPHHKGQPATEDNCGKCGF